MKRILIATDPYLCKSLSSELTGDFQVCCCWDTQETIRLLDQLCPDGLVLQLWHPEMDGLSVLRESKYIPPATLAISTFVSHDALEYLKKQGVAFVLTTPCKGSYVASILRRLMDLS